MGTWSHPGTAEKAKRLAKLMKHPISQKDAYALGSDLLGNDAFFDHLDETGDCADVRYAIANLLKSWLTHIDSFFEPWEPKAIAICEQLVLEQEFSEARHQVLADTSESEPPEQAQRTIKRIKTMT